jgi:flagellar hook-associated protein 2
LEFRSRSADIILPLEYRLHRTKRKSSTKDKAQGMSSSSSLSSLLSSSSSSVDISSILQAAFGASSAGIDVASAVSAGVTAARAPENAWYSQGNTLQSQISALTQIQTHVSSLESDMESLNSIVGPLSAMTVSSSNSNVATASAALGSTVGNHVIVVNNLATTASWISATYASSTTTLPADSFTITTGSGTSTTITTDGTQTLADVASQINSGNLGLTASVITDATGARLAIVANSTGSAANFTVTPSGSTSLTFTQAATGSNASLTVDGIAVSSATNTVTGAIPGVTISLAGANPGVQVNLSVAPDTAQIQSALEQFVSDYNTVMSDLTSQFTFSGTSQGILATDSTVRDLQNSILSAINYTATSATGTTTIPNLSALGITADHTGQLTIDSSKLQSVLKNNFSDVQNFFQGTTMNGFANAFDQQLTSFTNSSNGAFTVDLQSMNSQVSDLEDSINNFEANYITPLKAQLQASYSKAEIALQQLPVTIKQLQAQLGYNNSNG